MTKTDYRYRLSFSAKDKTTDRFYNLSAAIDDPTDPDEVRRTIQAIKSDGMGDVLAGLEAFVDFQIRTQPEPKPAPAYPDHHASQRASQRASPPASQPRDQPKLISDKQRFFLEARMKEADPAVMEIMADFMDGLDKHNVEQLTCAEAFNLVGRIKGGT